MAKRIIDGNELTMVEKYLLTQSNNVQLIKDMIDGDTIHVAKWCRYVESKEDKDDVTILSILSNDNKVYCTNSETFFRSFNDIADLMSDGDTEELPFIIEKISGISKSGRPFVNCILHLS